ncbi:MAG: ATP-binding protein [Polyangiaceae bacterium]|nr:ATP-binding protein [Polyangiaceae bacterium]
MSSKSHEPESGHEERAESTAVALHEVSNALTVVLGWLDVALGGGSDEDLKDALTIAQEHARRGQRMARRAIGAEVEPQNLRRGCVELAQFVIRSAAPQASEKGVSLQVELDSTVSDNVEVSDTESLIQVLTNLLLNALAFSPRDSSITLAVGLSAQSVKFTVQDQGPGVPLQSRPQLFTAPESTRAGGAGIGLPYSRSLARRHGGELLLLDCPTGARFELHWPTASNEEKHDSKKAIKVAHLEGLRILLVDDDEALTTMVELGLEARGAQVLVAHDLEQLNRLLDRRPVLDLALLDLSPLGDRLEEVVDRLQACLPEAPIALLSGQPTGVPPEVEGRVKDWIRKPFEIAELTARIRALLASQKCLS